MGWLAGWLDDKMWDFKTAAKNVGSQLCRPDDLSRSQGLRLIYIPIVLFVSTHLSPYRYELSLWSILSQMESYVHEKNM